MASTIKIKNSSTAGAVPGSGDLVQGELAVNVTDKKIYTKNASGTIVNLGTTPSITDNGNAEAIVIDSSENIGIGVTPSAWSLGKAFEVGFIGKGIWANNQNEVIYPNNAYYNGGWKYSVSSYAPSQYAQRDGLHAWYTAASGTAGNAITWTQAMTLDASGNLGVGTTSPSALLEIAKTSGGAPQFRIKAANNSYSEIYFADTDSNSAGAFSYDHNTNALATYVNGSERMRIDSSGKLLVGVNTSSGYLDGAVNAYGASTAAYCGRTDAGSGTYVHTMWNTATSGNNSFVAFVTESAATVRGSITYNRGGGLTAYNTTSDYRAKTVNGSVQNALEKVSLLSPKTGRMNGAEFDIDFFVAHELAEVVPSAVTGEKDAVNEDGTPNYQMVDKSALIPLLTAAIQELKAEFDAYKATHP